MLGFALNVRLKKISGWNHQSIVKPTKLCTIFFDLPVHHYARIFKKLVSLTIKLSFSKKKKKKKIKRFFPYLESLYIENYRFSSFSYMTALQT